MSQAERDRLEKLSGRAESWALGTDKARLSVPLGEVRAALAEITRLRAEVTRLDEALADIAEDRGACSKCGRLAEMPSNCVSCDDYRRCTWAPRQAAEVARAARMPAEGRAAIEQEGAP